MIPIYLLNFALAFLSFQTYVVMGTVRDQAGQAIDAVRVSVTDENFQPVRTLFVDTTGHFSVKGLPPGRYTFRVETTGTLYEEQMQSVELTAFRLRRGGNETVSLDFVLKLKASKNGTPSTGLVFVQEVPDAAKAQFERGVNYLRNGDSQLAIVNLKRAIELFPTYFNALEVLGTEYVRNGQYDAALPILGRALDINRNAPRSLYAQGVAHLNLNHPGESIESLKKSDELSPNNVNVWMMQGLAYRLLSDFKQSEVCFRKALQIGGTAIAEAHFYLADILEKQDMYSEASRELEIYLKEGKNIKDRAQIKSMIEKLKDKAKERPKA